MTHYVGHRRRRSYAELYWLFWALILLPCLLWLCWRRRRRQLYQQQQQAYYVNETGSTFTHTPVGTPIYVVPSSQYNQYREEPPPQHTEADPKADSAV